ncbi:MAG: hypothetical protein KKG64_03735, partial [Firmicutes bacterium]|nr:hypothetical protein [Bacillota bacterium]
MDQFLEVLFKFLIVVGISASIALISFFIWTAVFIPIVKLRQHNIEKQKEAQEAHKIEIKKAESILLIDEKKKEYEDLVLRANDQKVIYDKWKYKNSEVTSKFEAWLKLEQSKDSKNKSKSTKS